jgi:hypothetical protein
VAAARRNGGLAAEASEVIELTLVDLLTGLREQRAGLETRIKQALRSPRRPVFTSLPEPAPCAPQLCSPRSAIAGVRFHRSSGTRGRGSRVTLNTSIFDEPWTRRANVRAVPSGPRSQRPREDRART